MCVCLITLAIIELYIKNKREEQQQKEKNEQNITRKCLHIKKKRNKQTKGFIALFILFDYRFKLMNIVLADDFDSVLILFLKKQNVDHM